MKNKKTFLFIIIVIIILIIGVMFICQNKRVEAPLNFLQIKELGIGIPLSSRIEDLTYNYNTDSKSVGFTSKSLIKMGGDVCRADTDSLGSIFLRNTSTTTILNNDEISAIITIGDKNIFYLRSTNPCSLDPKVLDYAYTQVFALEDSLKSAQLLTPIFSVETYTNTEYGFTMQFPASWRGYTVVKSTWTGWLIDGTTTYTGTKLIFKNPQSTPSQPWQDIPLMIITPDVWKLISAEKVAVSAAPVGPGEVGENQNYIFATPPRWWGFTDALGGEEAVNIVKTFKVLAPISTPALQCKVDTDCPQLIGAGPGGGPLFPANRCINHKCVLDQATTTSCTSNWICGWGACNNGYQGMMAVDNNNCELPNAGANIACPALARKCTN